MGTSKYNLEQLGWFNFEQLVRTLLRQVIGNGLSTFSGSVDQGRDATFTGEAALYPSTSDRWSGAWIFQVKHRAYSTRGASAVRAELKRSLPADVAHCLSEYRHNCDNYVAITNCPLTSRDKDDICKLIRASSALIKNAAILGESDIHELLDVHPNVVSAFPQILGISQLRELVAWGLHRRSLEYLLAAQADIATFVATGPYLSALDLLHKQHFCVLSGPPKMGKTCTAYALAASFSASSYEVFDLRSQKDFYDAYQDHAKQLFICDDVFGDISMQTAQRDDWTRGFLRLLGSLGRDHKLVWTAREYILREALETSRLREERPALTDTDKVTVAVDHLSRLERAMILYNHARVASLPEDVRSYLRGPACLAIADHPNFSPESIRLLCTGRLLSFSDTAAGDATTLAAQVSAFLAEPGEAWKAAYRSAHMGERLLCTEVMAAGGSIQLSQLRLRYERTIQNAPDAYKPFSASLANAQGSFLRRKSHHPLVEDSVQFYHPSMRDLLSELIQTDKATRIAYLKQLALKELPAIAWLRRISVPGGSEAHRIAVTDPADIALLRDHIITALLPQATLQDASAVVSHLRSAISLHGPTPAARRTLRDSQHFAPVFWMILDTVVPHVCARPFWQCNADCAVVVFWRFLFDNLRLLLPLVSEPTTPEYVPELLRRRREDLSVDYWGLVLATHRIVPTIAEQCVDLSDRQACRVHLAEVMEQAISEAESLDLRNNYADSQQWHDNYGSLPEDCEDYAGIFPDDDPISGATELSRIISDYPRLEDEPDEEPNYSSLHPTSSDSDEEILQIFSDL